MQRTTQRRFVDTLKVGALVFATVLPLCGGCVRKSEPSKPAGIKAKADAGLVYARSSIIDMGKISLSAKNEIDKLAGQMGNAQHATMFKAVAVTHVENSAKPSDLGATVVPAANVTAYKKVKHTVHEGDTILSTYRVAPETPVHFNVTFTKIDDKGVELAMDMGACRIKYGKTASFGEAALVVKIKAVKRSGKGALVEFTCPAASDEAKHYRIQWHGI